MENKLKGGSIMAKNNQTQHDLEHHADQLNGNKGTSGENAAHKAARDNRANQLNPENPKY